MLGFALDTAATLAAIAGGAGRLVADRVLARADLRPVSVPRAISQLTPAWMTRALQAEFPRVRVSAVAPLEHHAGTTDRCRLTLSYDATPQGAQPPATVFVKLAPASLTARLFGDLMELGTSEVRFYRELAREVPVEVPRAFHVSTAGFAAAFVLVLEDLAERGASFSDVSQRATAELASRVARELARLHGAFWDSPRLRTDLAWLKGPDRNPALRLERSLCRATVGLGVRRFPEVVPDEVREACQRIVAARDRLDAYWSAQPLTLIHGDSHIGNLYFIGERVGFLDWQVVQRGPGLRDLSYFLINSISTETRREHERRIIAEYLAVLRELGVAAPTLDQAWEQHRLLAFHAFIAAAVTAAARELQPEAIARAGLARACAAIVDLESLRALDRLGA